MSDKTPALPVTTITPPRGRIELNLRELWEYRELLFFLARRDLSIRYRQSIIGAAWAVIQPVTAMVVFSIFFGALLGVPSDNVPYPVFSYAALLPWRLFATAMSSSSMSMVANSNLLTKVYFPRLALPLSGALPPLADFCIALVVLIGMMLFYGIYPTLNVLWLPVLVLLTVMIAEGMGIWFAALNVRYRDIGQVTPFLIQFGLFVSPVVYPASMVPGRWKIIYSLNPMTGIIEGTRWAMLGTTSPPVLQIAISAVVALVLLLSGMICFRRMEKSFADVV